EFGSAVIKKESYAILDQVVGLMKTYPTYSCDISGHTDNVGNSAVNQSLSEKRAKACLDYLVSKGVEAKRMTSAGYGDTKPVGDNKTSQGRKLNRRTEFLMSVK
ncbi:MAG TPA: OmpA family protein, partial [Saprospiraceae bacterium]|nr:OmpA family protein [Saprospiraceae bacterium]